MNDPPWDHQASRFTRFDYITPAAVNAVPRGRRPDRQAAFIKGSAPHPRGDSEREDANTKPIERYLCRAPTGKGTAGQRARSRTYARVKPDLVVTLPCGPETAPVRQANRVASASYHWDWTENVGTVISAVADAGFAKLWPVFAKLPKFKLGYQRLRWGIVQR